MTPTGFDWIVIAVVLASALLAFLRGIIKELLALAAWVVGLGAALVFAGPVGALLPEIENYPNLRFVLAFVAILVAALVVGALLAWMLRGGARAIGLGFVDRGLGAVFGVARGLVVILVFVIIAGSAGLGAQLWWQNSVLAPWLARGALALKGNLPPVWADKLDSALGRKDPSPRTVKT